MNDTSVTQIWPLHADLLQNSLSVLYGSTWPQYMHNIYPYERPDDDKTFNYWWLAHLIDCRLDAYNRSNDVMRLNQAKETWRNIIDRNGDSLFNNYFDDMLWFALAALRMWDATKDEQYCDAAIAIWNHVIESGWNDIMGESLAWRKQQLYYKNTPANGPLAILGARLHRITGEHHYLHYAQVAFDWIGRTLRDANGFVGDGINRLNNGNIDDQWRFTYNQGLYVGAAVELSAETENPELLSSAMTTALLAIKELSDGTSFHDEGEGGDEGLFKGIYYRYVGLLIDAVDHMDIPNTNLEEGRKQLTEFIIRSTDSMWRNAVTMATGAVLVGNDWSASVQSRERVFYSTMLSAVMAAEIRARLCI